MLICGGSIEASEGTRSIAESEGTGSIAETDGTGSLLEHSGSEGEAEGSEELFGSLVGKELSRVVGSSEGMLLSRFISGSDPAIDIVETAGSDKESVAETGEGVEAIEGEV